MQKGFRVQGLRFRFKGLGSDGGMLDAPAPCPVPLSHIDWGGVGVVSVVDPPAESKLASAFLLCFPSLTLTLKGLIFV